MEISLCGSTIKEALQGNPLPVNRSSEGASIDVQLRTAQRVWNDNAAGSGPIIEILLGECLSVVGGAGNGSEEQAGMRTAHLDGALYPSTGSAAFV